MPQKEHLDEVINNKITPIINTSMQKFMGITIKEVSADISDKLKRTPLLDFKISVSLPFKKAKEMFKRNYIKRLLEINQGSISDVARVSGIDRRSVHRFTKNIKKDLVKIRKETQIYNTETVISGMIGDSISTLKGIIRPDKLNNVYRNVTSISKDILKELPVIDLTLKEALQEFEKEYLKKALKENNGNISKTAKAVGIRAETLFRKIKTLDPYISQL